MKKVRSLGYAMALFMFVSCAENKEDSSTSTVNSDTTVSTTPASAVVTSPQHMILVKHRVANYEKWIPAFEAHDSDREAHGVHKYVVGRNVEDPNMVFAALKADDMDKAMAFSKLPSLKEAMQKGGVTGPPDVSFVTVVWQDTAKIDAAVRSLVTFDVKDWKTWQTGFEAGRQQRIDNGISDRVYGYDAANNNKVTIVTAIIDSAKATAYWNSDMLKKNWEERGVIGQPTRFLFHITKRY